MYVSSSRYFHIRSEMVNGKSVRDPFLTCRSCSTLYWWFSLTKQIAIKPPLFPLQVSCTKSRAANIFIPQFLSGIKRVYIGEAVRTGGIMVVSWWSALLLRSREQSVRLVIIITRLYLSHSHPRTISSFQENGKIFSPSGVELQVSV